MMDALAQVLEGNAILTNSLYRVLAKQDGNVFFSPFSIHTILSTLHQGAEDETAKILADVLKIPDAKSTALAYKSILTELKSIEDAVLLMANKICIRQSETFEDEFKKEVREKFDSEVEVVDFEKNKSGAVKKINKWIAKKTGNKIKEIVNVEMIDEGSALVLINALYFKGDWFEHFKKGSTTSQEFYVKEGSTVNVEMMKGTKTGYYKYDEDLMAQVVALPFQNRRIQLVIVLPEQKDGIKNLEEKLVSTSLTQLTKNLYKNVIDLSLPKFKLETSMDLNEILSEIGLKNIFDAEYADLRGMIVLKRDENLSVDKIIQKAFLEINEWGAEAAASTVVKLRKVVKCGRVPTVVTFTVDHPAIFMLVDSQDDFVNILFYGRLSHPK
jgi:serpin B